jgi:hypothetical protein
MGLADFLFGLHDLVLSVIAGIWCPKAGRSGNDENLRSPVDMKVKGAVASVDREARLGDVGSIPVSDRTREFVERRSDPQTGERVDAEFVVAATDVLHEGVAPDDHAGGAVALQPAHRSKPGLESTVVGFDSVVRVLGGVVVSGRAGGCPPSPRHHATMR